MTGLIPEFQPVHLEGGTKSDNFEISKSYTKVR